MLKLIQDADSLLNQDQSVTESQMSTSTKDGYDVKRGYNIISFNLKNPGDKEVRWGDITREFQTKGLQIQDANFPANLITNKSTTKGVVHVRAKTQVEIEKCKEILEKRGLEVKVANKYKPTWKI